jgi:hypothetical protein
MKIYADPSTAVLHLSRAGQLAEDETYETWPPKEPPMPAPLFDPDRQALLEAYGRMLPKIGHAIVGEQTDHILCVLANFAATCCAKWGITHETFLDLMALPVGQRA